MLSRRELEVVQWAQRLFERNFCILDTETTGLGDSDEIVEIAILDKDDCVLLNRLVKPTVDSISEEVINIHGISYDHVKNMESFELIWPRVREILGKYNYIIAYNAVFDMRMITQTCGKFGFNPKLESEKWHCLMNQYAIFIGDWNDYFGNYQWQKLSLVVEWASQFLECEYYVSHRALNDCKNILLVLKALAKYPKT